MPTISPSLKLGEKKIITINPRNPRSEGFTAWYSVNWWCGSMWFPYAQEHDQPAKAEELMRQALQIGPVPEVQIVARGSKEAKDDGSLWKYKKNHRVMRPTKKFFGLKEFNFSIHHLRLRGWYTNSQQSFSKSLRLGRGLMSWARLTTLWSWLTNVVTTSQKRRLLPEMLWWCFEVHEQFIRSNRIQSVIRKERGTVLFCPWQCNSLISEAPYWQIDLICFWKL